MRTEQLQLLAVEALNNLKAIDLTTIDVHEITSITDVMIICSGSSNRHVKSLAENVIKKAKEYHVNYLQVEGEKEGEWIIVDLADVVVHIMLPTTRAFYNLEDLWEPIQTMREQCVNTSSGHR
jgi:ribosome-associated protein